MDGRCFVYVLPGAWEDLCKLGFSRDPLARLQQFHPRWFEFFDIEHAMLVETETVRDARDLELELRRPLAAHKAPMPLTIRASAGGHTEWLRGAGPALEAAVADLKRRGHHVHAPARDWLRDALLARIDLLYDWSHTRFVGPLGDGVVDPATLRALRDMLDAHVALAIDPEPWLAPAVHDWFACGS